MHETNSSFLQNILATFYENNVKSFLGKEKCMVFENHAFFWYIRFYPLLNNNLFKSD